MIYLDNAATTAPLVEAVEAANIYIKKFYNPSALYSDGIAVADDLRGMRASLASCVCPSNYECVFTSCGTESDNTAIFSFAKRGNAVTTLGEHPAVYEPFRSLSAKGVEVRYAKLNKDGSVNVEHLLSLIDKKTSFVSVVHVNNETGAINDVNAISAQVKMIGSKVVFHSDGVQAFGHLPFRLSETVDLYSVSAHKIGAFKGIGALFKSKKLHLNPYICGGGQEDGMRSGTENTFGIAAFERAARLRYDKINENYSIVKELKSMFLQELGGVAEVLSSENACPYVLSLSADGLKGEVLQHMLELEGVIVGTGSACSSKKHNSRVLKECGHKQSILDGVVRISFCPENTKEEVLFAAKCLKKSIIQLKAVIE